MSINNLNVNEINQLISPAFLLNTIKISPLAYENVILNRQKIKNVLDKKDDKLLVIVGPCSIHDIKAAKEYAKLLKKISDKLSNELIIVMRTYFEKPRTKIGRAHV